MLSKFLGAKITSGNQLLLAIWTFPQGLFPFSPETQTQSKTVGPRKIVVIQAISPKPGDFHLLPFQMHSEPCVSELNDPALNQTA